MDNLNRVDEELIPKIKEENEIRKNWEEFISEYKKIFSK